MKILVIHNIYQVRGGEESVVAQEEALLRRNGHEVLSYRRANNELDRYGAIGKLMMPQRMIWASDVVRHVQEIIYRDRPDIAHIHNTHFMMSPAVIHACADMGVPVVHTLHNYRLVCPAATLFRDGHVCEECLDKSVPYPGVLHGCFRDSRTQSAMVATTNTVHRQMGTYSRVSHYITPSEFARSKLIQGGLDPKRVTAKPHFLAEDPAEDGTAEKRKPYMLYVGRLSPEKGSDILLDAWKQLPDIPLKIIGDGPLVQEADAMLGRYPDLRIELLGRATREGVYQAMRHAYALVVPSPVYETFGMVIVEAFSLSTPVIASGHGALAELIQHEKTGLHFTPGNPDHLAIAVRKLWDSPDLVEKMRPAARRTFEQRYTANHNYEQLMAIYNKVL